MREAVIVSTARTPIGKAYKGAFNNTHGATLAGHAVKKAIEIYNDVCDYFLLDKKNTSKNGYNGGTGENFDWNLISKNKNWLNQFNPWILSGGLNINNIEEAIKITGTKAVDVSSGIEYNPGIKSIELMDLFVNKIYRKNSKVS